MGEDPGVNMGRPFARFANGVVRQDSKNGGNKFILVEGLGEINVGNIRFRDALEQGMLRAYTRQEALDPKVQIFTSTLVALGAVAFGVRHIRHRSKKS